MERHAQQNGCALGRMLKLPPVPNLGRQGTLILKLSFGVQQAHDHQSWF
jgi:hypothetical protein